MKKFYRILKRWKTRTKFVKKVLIGPNPRKIAMKTQSKPPAGLLYFFILKYYYIMIRMTICTREEFPNVYTEFWSFSKEVLYTVGWWK